MDAILLPVAHWLNVVLPDAVHLPSLTFVLPHAAYWLGVLLFPFFAMYMVRRAKRVGPPRNAHERIKPAIAWLLWVGGGFVGLHRFYLRASPLGFVYVVLFVLIVYGSNSARDSRDAVSEASNQLEIAQFDSEHYADQVQQGVEGAETRLAEARAAIEPAQSALATAAEVHGAWLTLTGALALVILILMLIDAVRMNALIARCRSIEAKQPPPSEPLVIERGGAVSARRSLQTPFTRGIDAVNDFAGTFTAYWSVLAVAAYYFEVVARYVFNSPTNWVHESMFLMFGMQYLLSGGFVLRGDGHVRVDVIYEQFSERARAITDLLTSVVFFIFTVSLIVTGYIFAADSIRVWEVSFTEWAIQYWPIKCTIAIGGVLITLQGATNVVQDVMFLRGRS